jgi:hypothetical protein
MIVHGKLDRDGPDRDSVLTSQAGDAIFAVLRRAPLRRSVAAPHLMNL